MYLKQVKDVLTLNGGLIILISDHGDKISKPH